jgi:zinc protease
MKVALLFLAALIASVLSAAEPAASTKPATPLAASYLHPTEGTLPNGLRYTVLPHARESGRVSLRLVVLAGSLDERDDERGYAHFVEHMAFNGTRHYPSGKLVDFFQSLGLGLGADLWAGTWVTHTTYKIDLPAGRSARLDEALEVLRDFSDGIAFDPAEVQREKGVVLSELAARNTNDAQVYQQRVTALYRGTLVPDRLPGGDAAIVERATAESLRAYYLRCYHPARLRLVIAGDIEVAAAQALIERHFASLKPSPSAVAQVLPTAPPRAPLQADVVLSATPGGAGVGLFVVERLGPATQQGRASGLTRALALRALDRRLVDRRAANLNRFGVAHARYGSGPDERFTEFMLETSTTHDGWEDGVALLESELRRARDEGFNAAELAEQVTVTLAAARSYRDSFAGYLPDAVASAIASSLATDQSWIHPAESLALAETVLPKTTKDEVRDSLREIFGDDRLHLVLFRSAPPANGRDAVFAAYRASADRPLPARGREAAPVEFRYDNFGVAGAVRLRSPEKDIAVDLVRFANGVQFNVRPSATEPNRFRLAAHLGRGIADSPRNKPGFAHLAAHFFAVCDLGRHTLDELNRLLETHAIRAHSTSDDGALRIEMEGPANELPFALRVLTARISDTRLDRSRFFTALSAYANCRSSHLDNSARFAGTEAAIQMAGDDPRLRDSTMEEAGRLSFSELADWMRSRWFEGPIEIGVTGDIDPVSITASAGGTVGTLPPRRVLPPAVEDQLTLRTQPAQLVRREVLPDQTAAVQLSWSAPGFGELRRRRALTLALDVLVDRLQRTLRQELGATYSPYGVIASRDRQPDFGYATVALTFEPAQVEAYTRRAIALAHTLATEGMTAEEFARLREPLIAATAESLRSNDWWLDNVLICAQGDPSALDAVRSLGAAYAQLTREEVNRVAADFFRADRASSLVVLPVSPDQGKKSDSANPLWALARRAEAKLNQGDFDGAFADFTAALALEPDNAELYLSRARVKSAEGDLSAALIETEEAIRLDPKNASAFNVRAAIKIASREFDAAIADCTQAIAFDPAFVLPYVNRAYLRIIKGDPAGASADATHALDVESRNAVAYALRGTARLMQGDKTRAAADLDRALELDPNVPHAHRNRGALRLQQHDLPGALADFNRALELSPDDVGCYSNRALVKDEQGDHKGAIADYDRALKLVTDNPALLLNNRGYARQRDGDLDGAIADYTRALDSDPNLTLALANRSLARKAKGDLSGAAEDAEKASRAATLAKLNTSGSNLLTPLFNNPGTTKQSPAPLTATKEGDLKRANKDYKGALADYTKALETNPEDHQAYYGRGVSRRLLRDDTGAIADFTKCLELNPKANNAFIERGKLLLNRRDFNRALADFTAAIELYPKLSVGYYYRGLTYEGLENSAQAFSDFDIVVTLKPDDYQAINGRGNARQARGDYEGALRDFDDAILKAPDYAPTYYNRGFVRQIQQDTHGALDDYNLLLTLRPDYPNGRTNRGHIREMLNDFSGALEDYEQASGPPTLSRTAPLYRWIVERRLNKPGASEKLARTITRWPSTSSKTIARFFLGEITEAAFLAGAEEDSKDTWRSTKGALCETRYYAGMVRLLNGDVARARELFEESLETRLIKYHTFMLARAELARLNQAPATPVPTPASLRNP